MLKIPTKKRFRKKATKNIISFRESIRYRRTYIYTGNARNSQFDEVHIQVYTVAHALSVYLCLADSTWLMTYVCWLFEERHK